MDFMNPFVADPRFSSGNPGDYNYRQERLRLQQQMELAQRLQSIQPNVTGHGAGALNAAGILAQALGGYTAGRGARAELDNEKAAAEQAKFYTGLLRAQKSEDELRREAETFHPNAAPKRIEPDYSNGPRYSQAADSQAAYDAMPNQGLMPQAPPMAPQVQPVPAAPPAPTPAPATPTPAAPASQPAAPPAMVVDALLDQRDALAAQKKQIDQQLSSLGSVQRQQNPAAFNALQQKSAQLEQEIFKIENSIAPAAGAMRQSLNAPQANVGRPAPAAPRPAPVAPQAAQPSPQPQPQAIAEPQPQRAPGDTAPWAARPATYAPDEEGQANVTRDRMRFMQDAIRRQSAQRGEAEQVLEQSQNPYAVSFLKRMAAQRAAQADIDTFTRKEQIKAAIGRDPIGKPIGTPQPGPDGKMFQTIQRPNGTIEAVEVKGATDGKTVAAAAEKANAANTSLNNIARARSDLQSVLSSDAPEQATGLSGLLGSAAAKVGFDNRWADARKQVEGLTAQAISAVMAEMAASGQSANQLLNTQLEAARAAATKLNADAGTMSPEMLRRELQKFDDMMATTERTLKSQVGRGTSSGASVINGLPAYQRGVTLRPGQ